MKKVLIIVYYWPPSGGAGVQRWLKFVKYLPQFGWQPTVITTKNGDYPAIDNSLENDVPEDVQVIRTKTPTFGKFFSKKGSQSTPYGSLEINKTDSFIKRLSIWIRLNLIIPDARIIWNKYALKDAKKELENSNYNCIITSGPPHSTHLIGLKLKKKFKIKWIADFRDPWMKIDYLEKVKRNPITENLDRKLEDQVVQNCDLVLSINRKIISDFKIDSKSRIIPNGFDPEDFKDIQKKENDKFTISYFGNITIERNPEILLKALNQIPETAKKISLEFWGNVSKNVIEKLKVLDEHQIVTFHSYISHQKALQKMISSNLLLLIINNIPDNEGILTGKIYEYLGSGVPILGIGPVNGEAAAIMNETDSGQMFDYNDKSGILDFIKKHFNTRRKVNRNRNKIEKYSRKEQTKLLAEILSKP